MAAPKKPVGATDKQTRQAIRGLVDLLVFLDENRQWRMRDALDRPEFEGTALHELLEGD